MEETKEETKPLKKVKYKNIFGSEINVMSKPLAIDEVREIEYDKEPTEIKNLVKHKYLERVE